MCYKCKLASVRSAVRHFISKADPNAFHNFINDKIVSSKQFKTFRKSFKTAFKEQYLKFTDEAILDEGRTSINKAMSNPIWDLVVKYMPLTDDYIDRATVNEYLLYAAIIGGQKALDKFGITGAFNLKSLNVIKALADRDKLLIRSVDTSTREGIANLLSGGYDEGLTNPEIARLIREKYPEIARYRADMIARTETSNAMMQTELETARQNGIEQKTWVTDSNACDICEGNVDGEWHDLNDSFASGDDAPPVHPNCECYCDYQVSEYADLFDKIPWTGV